MLEGCRADVGIYGEVYLIPRTDLLLFFCNAMVTVEAEGVNFY